MQERTDAKASSRAATESAQIRSGLVQQQPHLGNEQQQPCVTQSQQQQQQQQPQPSVPEQQQQQQPCVTEQQQQQQEQEEAQRDVTSGAAMRSLTEAMDAASLAPAVPSEPSGDASLRGDSKKEATIAPLSGRADVAAADSPVPAVPSEPSGAPSRGGSKEAAAVAPPGGRADMDAASIAPAVASDPSTAEVLPPGGHVDVVIPPRHATAAQTSADISDDDGVLKVCQECRWNYVWSFCTPMQCEFQCKVLCDV